MNHDPLDVDLPEMPLPPELPPDEKLTAEVSDALWKVANAARRETAEQIAEACAARARISQRAPESMTGVREGTWLAVEKLAREIGAKEVS